MTTSWHNTKIIEEYLAGTLDAKSRMAFDTKLLVSPLLRMNLRFQKKVYIMVKLYNRKKVKEELEAVHQRIFGDPDKVVFRQNIYKYLK